jgi:hypothetical protein
MYCGLHFQLPQAHYHTLYRLKYTVFFNQFYEFTFSTPPFQAVIKMPNICIANIVFLVIW